MTTFLGMEPGAGELLKFCLQLRGNPRTRRSEHAVRGEWRMVHGGRAASKWFTSLAEHCFGAFRQWRKFGFPWAARLEDEGLSQKLSKRDRSKLKYTGAVKPRLPALNVQAADAFRALRDELVGKQALVWLDNWYCERYGTDPLQPVMSTDVTAVAVLLLDSADDRPAARTRSHDLPTFRGHVGLLHLTMRVEEVANEVNITLVRMLKRVQEVTATPWSGTAIRVPLDIQRPARRALHWRPYSLSELRVSSNVELTHLLADLLALQERTGHVLPLLVDEKVHYAISRMLLSRGFNPWDVKGWLHRVPLLYGVWPELTNTGRLHTHA